MAVEGTVTPGWRDNATARPDTIARLEKVLELLAVHGFIEPACRQAHLSKKTLYEYQSRYSEFAEEVEQAKTQAKIELEATGWACARKALSDPRYQPTLALALRCKAGWKDTLRVDLNAQGKAEKDPRDLTDEELLALIEKSRADLEAREPS